MTTTTWAVTVELTLSRPLTEDEAFEVLDGLAERHASVSGGVTGRLGATLDGVGMTWREAGVDAEDALRAMLPPGVSALVESLEVQTLQAQERAQANPLIPDLVGYAEIGEIAGVSRQRARQFEEIPDFPQAVVRTATGPLRVRSAVEEWARTRNRRGGRPAAS